MKVPFVDVRAQNDQVRLEIEIQFGSLLDTSSFIGGAPVAMFEQHFAQFCGAEHAVTCANGTDALKLALMAAGVSAGDEVVTVPHTFIATVEAISMVGAYPVFVDIDGPTYTMSPARLTEFLEQQCRVGLDGRLHNTRTGRPVKAVLPVHLYGLVADMAPILELAAHYGLVVVEDACQAHGATYRLNGVEQRAGTFGAAAAFSFYPGKNLGGLGEGGAVTTNNAAMAAQMRVWRDHGQSQKYVHVTHDGWNSRLDTLQCAVLDLKLAKLAEWNKCRRQAADWYYERLAGDERLILPLEPAGRRHVYHLFVVRLPDREAARHLCDERGVGVGLHYPIPLHLQAAYRHMGLGVGCFPETEQAAASILSLPMFPHITETQVDYVCAALKEYLDQTGQSHTLGLVKATS